MRSLQRNRFKVGLFSRLVALANWLASLPNKLMPAPFRLLQIESAYWQSRALYVAAKLGIADALGDRERSSTELAAALALHEDSLYRLLRMLASIGVFQETAHRQFRNNALSAAMRSDSVNSVREMILLHNSEVMSRPWMASLEEGIRSGEPPFLRIHGAGLFDYMEQHPDFDAQFARAMDAVEGLTGLDYLQDFDWSGFDRLVDVGGSKGAKSMAILKQNPQLEALVFDRQQVVETAESFWRSRGAEELLERVTFLGGDMFETIPVARSDRDLYLCMALFHGIGDDEAARVLANLRRAFAGHRPTLLIVDTVAEEVGLDPNIAAMDMQMLVNTHGRERTEREWQRLFRENGFSLRELVPVRTFARFIVVDPVQAAGRYA